MTEAQRGEKEARDYALGILERLKDKFVGNSNTCGELWWFEQKKAWGLAIAAVDYEIEQLNEWGAP